MIFRKHSLELLPTFSNFAMEKEVYMSNDSADIIHGQPVPTAERLTLRKGEKLRHRTLVDTLFSEGESVYEYPFRLTWRLFTGEQLADAFRAEVPARMDNLQMLITVPKKKRRRAVDRVLMRRRIREAYRLHRLPLRHKVDGGDLFLSLAFVYIADKNLPYSNVERKMKLLLKKVAEKL